MVIPWQRGEMSMSMSSLTNDGSRLTISLVLVSFVLNSAANHVSHHSIYSIYLYVVFRSNMNSLCLVNSSSYCIKHVTNPVFFFFFFLALLASGQRIDT